jgi:transcription-repair coupling factor (superfamily II helicase)
VNINSLKLTKLNIGLSGSALAWAVARIHQLNPKKALSLICKDFQTAEKLEDDLNCFIPDLTINRFPNWDTLPFEAVSPSLSVTALRNKILLSLNNQITIFTPDSLQLKHLPIEALKLAVVKLELSMVVIREDLLKTLYLGGFNRVDRVLELGDFAVRGEVIDIFTIEHENPVRIRFFDNEIEALNTFSIESQRTIEALTTVIITPLREYLAPHLINLDVKKIIEKIKHRSTLLETPLREVLATIQNINESIFAPGIELFNPIIFEELNNLSVIFAGEKILIVIDSDGCREKISLFNSQIESRYLRALEAKQLIPEKNDLYVDIDTIYNKVNLYTSYIFDSFMPVLNDSSAQIFSILPHSELIERIKNSNQGLKPLIDYLNNLRNQNLEISIVIGTEARAKQLINELEQLKYFIDYSTLSLPEWLNQKKRSKLTILRGNLATGFIARSYGFAILGEEDIFIKRSLRYKSVKKLSERQIMSGITQLKNNDFIVHLDYGIGRYNGLVHKTVEGVESDFLDIDYADSKLLLPVQMIGKIQKYSSAENKEPKLDKLSSTRWATTKKKVQESVVALAGDLIKLYAKRSVVKGWQFDVIGAEDERFAETFPYNETPDQLKAIEETLNDMASDKPMDRLICGDVGFGKTEVAMRASYKCIQHARQVAILVPTTVLADQHYRNFYNRFNEFKIKVGIVSRFQSNKENRETLELLANGTLDIIVGTHRLLSKDVKFKDLGLLILDEEHRFGVKQKESLKILKTGIDTLTLTATPIPRTLHSSLLGIRDMSIIATPPPKRLVVKNFVARESDELIRDVFIRELQRGGQAYFLHNRVESIVTATASLRKIVPEAKIEFAHGQMSEVKLEDLMRRFVNHDFDILVCTTIIESGIDIPNANTIIISKSHMYGLAQLYQLRGRVGRGNTQGFAYFLVPQNQQFSGVAQERLKVLQSLDSLGVGFHLASRDLEIRGAGNLLGKEQSGHVLSVGFDLYIKILKDAIQYLKGEDFELLDRVDPEVKLGVVAYIPDSYLPDVSERLIMYQRLANMWTSSECVELEVEIEDRFGPIPPEVKNLLEVMELRSLLRRYSIIKVERTINGLSFQLSPEGKFDLKKIISLCNKSFSFHKNLTLKIQNEKIASGEITIKEITSILEKLLNEISC